MFRLAADVQVYLHREAIDFRIYAERRIMRSPRARVRFL